MSRHCHHCGAEQDPKLTVGRRSSCLQCSWDLHCCLNCDFYSPGYNNSCRETEAERQVDKQAGNFCDYFRFKDGMVSDSKKDDAKSALDALFKK